MRVRVVQSAIKVTGFKDDLADQRLAQRRAYDTVRGHGAVADLRVRARQEPGRRDSPMRRLRFLPWLRFPISRQEPRYHQRSFAGHARGSPPPSRRGHATPSTGRPAVKAAPVDLHRGGPPDEGPGRPTIQRMTGRAYADDLSAALGRSGRTVLRGRGWSAVADAPSAPRESRRRLAGEPGACGRLHRGSRAREAANLLNDLLSRTPAGCACHPVYTSALR